MIKTDFINLYEELNQLNETYCLELDGYKVGDLVEYKRINPEHKIGEDDYKLAHGMILDVWPEDENHNHTIGIFQLDSWGAYDTPSKNITKKISITDLTSEEKNIYNKAKKFADDRIKELGGNSTAVKDENKSDTKQKAAQLSKKIIKAFKDAGLATDELIVKNGVGKTKASAKLKKLKQSLFGESLEEDFEEEIDLDE